MTPQDLIPVGVVLFLVIVAAFAIRDAYLTDYNHRKRRVYFLASRGLPRQEHLSPKAKYCWWWNSRKNSWEFCNARCADRGIYTYWAPWYVFPIPSDEQEEG
jgi:hypothetical protein